MEKFKMPRTINTLIGLGMGAAMLAGCGAEEPAITPGVEATVLSHSYDDADTWVSMMPVGKVMVPMSHYDPEHFYLKVEQCGHEEFMKKNVAGCGTFNVEVNENIYKNNPDGSVIVFNK